MARKRHQRRAGEKRELRALACTWPSVLVLDLRQNSVICMLSPAFRLTTTSSHSRAVSNDPSKKKKKKKKTTKYYHRQQFSTVSLAGDATSIIFVATSFVAKTKHVFCRNKSMLVATKLLILVAAPTSDRTVLLSRQQRTIATGPCTIALEIKSAIKSMRMKETYHRNSVSKRPVHLEATKSDFAIVHEFFSNLTTCISIGD